MKFLDKIALILGLLVFLISAGLYFLGGSNTSVPPEVDALTRSTGGGLELPDYAPFVEPGAAVWSEPLAQDQTGLWLYQVFTPPILYRVGDRFDVRPPVRENLVEVTIPAFGLEFSEVRRSRYRLQLLAVIERDLDDMTTARAVFENVEAGPLDEQTLRLSKGEVREKEQFDFVDLVKESVFDDGGGLQVIYRATIIDRTTGARVELVDNATRFRDEVAYVFRHISDPSKEILVTRVGQVIEKGDAVFTIIDISLADETVTVVKTAPYLETPVQHILKPGQSGPGPRTILVPADEVEALNLSAQPIYMPQESSEIVAPEEAPGADEVNSIESLFSN